MKVKLVVLAVFSIMLGGCIGEGKVTGGGWIVASDGVRKANYGFNGSSCDEVVKGHFNYHDKATGMKINGDVISAGVCLAESTDAIANSQYCISACAVGSHVVEFTRV